MRTYEQVSNYSSRGELLSVTKPDGTLISYDNDPMGRRITKRINGTITEKYLWKDAITLIAVYDGKNNILMRFNYADGRLPASRKKGKGVSPCFMTKRRQAELNVKL